MLRYCDKRLISSSLGFASMIEPVKSSGNLTPTVNLWKTFQEEVALSLKVRQFSRARPVTGQIICLPNLVNNSPQSHKNLYNADRVSASFSRSIKTSCSSFDLNADKKDSQHGKIPEPDKADDEESNMSIFQRFKSTYKKHGRTLLAVHVATSVVWFGSFYYIARSGIDIISWLEYYNFSPIVISPFKHAGLGDIAVGYLLYKVATPIRYTVTLGGTQLTIKYLKSTGYILPVSPEDSIRGLMKDSSDKMKERRTDFSDKMKEKRTDFSDKMKEKRSELMDQSREKIKSFRDKSKEEQEKRRAD